jgi:pyrrolidone-carboxylate peptidase
MNAGAFLCNYLFFKAVLAFPRLRIGFLHVPTNELVPLEAQVERFEEILRELVGSQNDPPPEHIP